MKLNSYVGVDWLGFPSCKGFADGVTALRSMEIAIAGRYFNVAANDEPQI